MKIRAGSVVNLCTYLVVVNVNLCESKVQVCDKLNLVNVDLQCYYQSKIIPCTGTSTLIKDTVIRPTCKQQHKYYGTPPNYEEIKCKDDGKWDNPLPQCIPECGKSFTPPKFLITGGFTDSIVNNPWHVAIYDREKILICGGTILSSHLIISAAHCFYNTSPAESSSTSQPDEYEVVVSKFSRNYNVKDNENQKTFKVADIRFSDKGFFGLANNFGSDIAILVLKKALTFGPAVLPACIDWTGVRSGEYLRENTPGKVVGWGLNQHEKYNENLTTTNLPFISHKRCVSIMPKDFKNFVTFDKFCAGTENGPSVRQGDSGGGLLFDKDGFYYIRGVVSLKQPKVTGIAAFTDIADHIDWIVSVFNEIERQSYRTSYLNYQVLYNETLAMKLDDDVIIMNLYNLSKGLETEVLNHKNITKTWKSQAQSLFDTIQNKMRTLAVKKITDAFLNDRLSTVSHLGSYLVNNCYSCFNQIISKVIDNVLGKLSTKALLVQVRKPNAGFCCIPELISIYTAVLDKLQQTGEIKTDSAILLAERVKEVMEWENYKNVWDNIRSQMQNVKNKLPKSVKIIVFSSKVCLRNVQHNELLFAVNTPASEQNPDVRQVNMFKGEDRYDVSEPAKFIWKLERNGDEYQIINSMFNEHLYAEDTNQSSNTTHVATWRKSGSHSGDGWKIEPEGEHVWIKNTRNGQYLFSDYTSPATKTDDNKWEVVDCSKFESNIKSKIADITKPISKSLRNIIFNTKICIRNVHYNEYLYAASPSKYWHDQNRRHVYTWTENGIHGPDEAAKFTWFLEQNDKDEYQIINSQFNERLYAEVDGSLLDGHGRYVLTWRKGGSRWGSLWKLELDGNDVYIRNARNNEYLFADNSKIKDNLRRRVFTYILGSKTNDSRWEFVDCGKIRTYVNVQSQDVENDLATTTSPAIILSDKICARNVRYNEYLYAAGSSTDQSDPEKRNVFTYTGGDRYDATESGIFVWKLERNEDDEYQIINSHFNEHLYADVTGSLPIQGHRRSVLTWKRGGSLVGSSWKFEQEGEYFYIKNSYNNEYLFAEFNKPNDDINRPVYSYVFANTKTDDSAWEILNCDNFESHVKSQLHGPIENLPISVKHIVTANKVCIKIVHPNEYLYAAGPSRYWYDQDRRYVFTWKGGEHYYGPDESPKFAWKLKWNNKGEYEIINAHFNEYLYAEVDGSLTKGQKRTVLTWKKGGSRLGSLWKFEPSGTDVYIKNVHYNEYLYVDLDEIRDDEKRMVFTYKSANNETVGSSLWMLYNCSHR